MTCSFLHRFCGAVFCTALLLCAGLSWGSDSIVGWTSRQTLITDGTTTISLGTIAPMYWAPGIGKYVVIDGKRYVETGSDRFTLQVPDRSLSDPSSGSARSSQSSHKHKRPRKTDADAYGKAIDAERNAAMTPSQKIYRDLKKNVYPEVYPENRVPDRKNGPPQEVRP